MRREGEPDGCRRQPGRRVRHGVAATTASHTIGIPHLVELLREVPRTRRPSATATRSWRTTCSAARRTPAGSRSFRHLRELYLLDPSRPAFAALRRLWGVDAAAQQLMAGILAFTRDGILRASFKAIQHASAGTTVTSDDLTKAVAAVYGADLSESTLGKTGRNTGACWTQTGHLAGRTRKTRQKVRAYPPAVAFATYLGHLAGNRGTGVLDTPWAALLDLPSGGALDALRTAHSQGLVDLLVAGSVVDVGFPAIDGTGR